MRADQLHEDELKPMKPLPREWSMPSGLNTWLFFISLQLSVITILVAIVLVEVS